MKSTALEIQQNTAISSKKRGTGTYVPEVQRQRILHRHLIGQSFRKISREERRDFRTVAKVIQNSPTDLKKHLEQGRAQFYALTALAIETVHKGLTSGDTGLAYRLLVDTGVVPQAKQVPSIRSTETENSQPEQILSDKLLGQCILMAHERARDYGLPSESLEMLPPRKALVADKIRCST